MPEINIAYALKHNWPIVRQVRFYAQAPNGLTYALEPDWNTTVINEKLDKLDYQEQQPNKSEDKK